MNARLALITFLDGPGGAYPDNTLPGVPPGPVDPGYGQGSPIGGHPWLPGHLGGPRPDQGLPGSGAYPTPGPVLPRPDNSLPGLPPIGPDNTLPDGEGPPPQVSLPIVLPPDPVPPGHVRRFELKYSYRYGWVLVPIEDEVAAPKKK